MEKKNTNSQTATGSAAKSSASSGNSKKRDGTTPPANALTINPTTTGTKISPGKTTPDNRTDDETASTPAAPRQGPRKSRNSRLTSPLTPSRIPRPRVTKDNAERVDDSLAPRPLFDSTKASAKSSTTQEDESSSPPSAIGTLPASLEESGVKVQTEKGCAKGGESTSETEARPPLESHSHGSSPREVEFEEGSSDDGSDIEVATSENPSSPEWNQSEIFEGNARPTASRFLGDGDGYGGKDAVFEVLSAPQATPGYGSGKHPPTFKSGRPVSLSPPTALSDEEDYIRQLAQIQSQNPAYAGPRLDSDSEHLFEFLSRPADTNPAKRAFLEYSRTHYDDESVKLGQAALGEVEAQSTEYMMQKLILETQKTTLEQGLLKTGQDVADLRAMQDANDPSASHKSKEIRRLNQELFNWETKVNVTQEKLDEELIRRRYLEGDLDVSRNKLKALEKEYKILLKHIKELENMVMPKQSQIAEDHFRKEADGLKAKIKQLEGNIKKLQAEIKGRSSRSEGRGGDQTYRGAGKARVSKSDFSIKSTVLSIDFCNARCELALRKMASDRAAYGFVLHDTDEAIEASTEAVSLAEQYAGDNQEQVVGRANFWAGVTYYYADIEQKANEHFKAAYKGLAGCSGYEASWVGKWVSNGSSNGVSKDAVSYQQGSSERRRTSSSTNASTSTASPKNIMRFKKRTRDGEEDVESREKKSAFEDLVPKSPEKREKSQKSRQTHPPIIKEESDEDHPALDNSASKTGIATPADTSNPLGISTAAFEENVTQKLFGEEDNIYDDSE